jgi:hypothetical protein
MGERYINGVLDGVEREKLGKANFFRDECPCNKFRLKLTRLIIFLTFNSGMAIKITKKGCCCF